jgi:hypothetical protein
MNPRAYLAYLFMIGCVGHVNFWSLRK